MPTSSEAYSDLGIRTEDQQVSLVQGEGFRCEFSVSSERREEAAALDPNNGKCLITHQSNPVDACHLIQKDLSSDQLSNLEWWWGMDRGTLDVDNAHNVIFLRPDLRHLMDNDYLMLVPDENTISFLHGKVPLESTERLKHPIDHFYTTKIFKYHIVPLRPMRDIHITRIVKDIQGNSSSSQFISHSYPYMTVGTLESHVYPHYVLFNAGEKMDKLMLRLEPFIFLDWIKIIFGPCLGIETETFKSEMLAGGYAVEVKDMYTRWSREPRISLSDYIRRSYAPTISSGTWPGGSNHKIQSLNRSLAGNSCYIFGLDGVKMRERDSIDSDGNSDEETVESHDEDQRAYDYAKSKMVASKWWEETAEAVAQQGGWDSNLVNDEQIGPYIDERSRSPRFEPWSTWRPAWSRVYSDGPPDTRTFSSNDWAYKEERVLLTEHRDFDDDTSCY